jgi:predicted lipoprotein with Yx(FWY)xxD motif
MRFTRMLCFLLFSVAAAGAFAQTASPPATAPAAAAPSSEPPIRKLNGHLVDLKGRGLYTWDGDIQGNGSQCNAQCRLLWPPLFADDNAVPKGPFTLVKRDDGRYQWALNGRPLYRWTSDKKWGDAGGDGVADMWRLVKVAPKKDAAK